MEGTSTTYYTPEVTSAVVAHGLMALGLHMAAHDLPLYIGMDTPDRCRGRDRRIEVHLRQQDLDEWAGSIDVDDTTVVTRDDTTYPAEYAVLGRLPDTGVRVRLYVLRNRAQLEAVRA